MRAEHGEPDVVQIRKLFETAEQARIWEACVISRIRAVKYG
jgi:hypothetical protein